jgi:radical SAM superfamily enzyme YgiQ (UPF0313 family)
MNGILFNVVVSSPSNRSAGVYRIAHFLREHGADIEVVDWANHWHLEQLQELFVSRYTTDLKFIGFSHMFSIWADVLEDFCKWVKEKYPTVKIISGSSSKPWFKTKYIDYYIMGFGEHAVLALTKYIAGNGPRPQFSLELANGKPLINANTAYTAYPMQSLMIKYEDRDFLQPTEWLGIETARGCKFKCDFCNFPVLGVKGDYSRDADDFELQLRDTYDRFGIKNYIIADETFNDRTEKITKFADVVEKLSFVPYFSAFIRADLLHSRANDLSELARMNVFGHHYGVESFNTASARAVGKGLNSEKIKSTLIKTKQYFKDLNKPYRGSISFIVGLPHESVESIRNTMSWLVDHWQEQSFIAFSLDLPASPDVKASLISQDYKKYGYRSLTEQELVNKSSLNSHVMDHAITTANKSLLWANEHMNIFRANELVNEFIRLREIHDFRYDTFAIGQRSTISTAHERVATSFDDFKSSIDPDISGYIHAKLSL